MLRRRVWRAVPPDWRIAVLLFGYAVGLIGIPADALLGVRVDWRAAKLSFVGSLVVAPRTLWRRACTLTLRLRHRRSGSRAQVAPLACLAQLFALAKLELAELVALLKFFVGRAARVVQCIELVVVHGRELLWG